MIHLFGRTKPQPRLTREEKAASAASYLAQYAAEKRREANRSRIWAKAIELRLGAPSPIASREIVVADVRAAALKGRAHG